MYFLLRPLLFLLSAEKAHHFSLGMLSLVYRLPLGKQVLKFLFYSEKKDLAQDLWGLHFKNPVGLAAGFDKNAKYIDALACLGFGFIEIGTVTPLPQDGNPLPRLFRLPKDKAIINRMGFNNDGVDAVVARLKKRKSDVIIGGNIGKNKITPNEEATKDYVICFEKLFDYVDYFVVNVSSPNTPNLREL
jgi:dihydroorotate dehydrogenase